MTIQRNGRVPALNRCWVALIALFLAALNLRANNTNSTDLHASAIGESVLRLLENREAEGFADAMAFTNQVNKREVLDSARLVLDQAARMGIEPSRVHFRIKEVQAKATGTSQDGPTKGLPTSFGIRSHPAGRAGGRCAI